MRDINISRYNRLLSNDDLIYLNIDVTLQLTRTI